MKQPLLCPTCKKLGYVKQTDDPDLTDMEISFSVVEPYTLTMECACIHCGTEFDEMYFYTGAHINSSPEFFKKDEENIT